MIETQTKLPVQEREPATGWTKGRQMVASIADRLKSHAQALPGTRGAQYLRNAGSLLSSKAAKLQFRVYLAQMMRWIGAGIGDGSLLSRYALHLVILLLAVGVVTVSQVTIPEVDLLLPTPTPAPDLGTHSVTAPPTNRGVNRSISNGATLFPNVVPHTTISERERLEVITYTVQPNDNIWGIAQGFGLKAETVLWANPSVEKSPDLLSVGQQLIIPPIDGIYYTVQAGDTAEKLAKTYQTSLDKIVSFNGLEEPYTLVTGQKVMLPDGRRKVVPPNYYPMTVVGKAPRGAPTGSGRFAWPTQGLLSQQYWSGHLGVDIANRSGVPIRAADAGYVVMAGRDTWGYGNQVVIDHGNGYMSRYAHLTTILVKAGASVEKNQKIGTMGSTGRSTGPHLHFEIIYQGVRRNPQGFLP